MQRALVLAAVMALAVARPETYKEKEDFQYSRSSSDDGTKSGFYGAQRGNMGGNYERSHNMDLLAQHQMGGLVKNVEGELGDGANQKSGTVFTAANSRGVYGTGHYDLSKLEGRNFQEGTSFGESQSQSSHSAGYGSQAYLAAHSAHGAHSHNSGYSGYQTTGNLDQALYANNMQASDRSQSVSQYDGTQAVQNSRPYSGYYGQSAYDQAAASSHLSNAYGSNIRLVSAQPVRVVVRPGERVTIPVAAQLDSSHGSASSFDHNAINSEAEVLGSNDQQTVYSNQPTNNAKHYESSYSYRKEWEKHGAQPVAGVPLAVPTVSPYPSNSELYEDTQAHGSKHQQQVSAHQEAQNVDSSSQYHGYNVKSASSSQSRHQNAYNYNAQQNSAASDSAAATNLADSSAYRHGTYSNGASISSLADSNAFMQGAHNHGASANLNTASLNNQVEDSSSKPRSYQSSYQYHKSWERQGDPYVIKPATNGVYTTADTQASQRLTASSLNQGESVSGSHQHGAHYHQGYSSHNGVDCDENGHFRVARSYNLAPYQQSQNIYEGQESQNLEDLSQQSQNLEELGQQTQNLENFGQQSQNLEDLGQQTQNLENFGQQSQNLEDLGQQTQNLENFGQQSQNLEDLGQQTQNLDNFGQQSQNLNDFDQLQDPGQQTQSKWDNLQQGQSQTDLGQQTQNTWNTLETIQDKNSGKDTEQQLNVMEHTGYTHHDMNTALSSQESIIQIEHPSNLGNLNKSESHTTQENNNQQNPFAHVTFNEQNQDQEQTELSETNIENQFTESENVGQQANNYWDTFQTNVNRNNQNGFLSTNPIDLVRPAQDNQYWQITDTHHLHLNPGHGNNQQTYFTDNTGHTNRWISPMNNRNNDFHQHGYGSSVHTYTNNEVHYADHSSHSLSHVQENQQQSGSTSITNLWNLLDNIEKETTSGDSSDLNYSYNQENKENVQSNSNVDSMYNLNGNSFNLESHPIYPVAFLPSTTEQSQTEITNKQDKHTYDLERGDIGAETNPRPQEDAGRGDIGPDNSSSENMKAQNKPLEIFENKPVPTSKPFKTPEEIETLSLTKETNKTTLVSGHNTNENSQNIFQNNNEQIDSEFGVISLDEQKQLVNHNEQDNWKLQSDIQKTTSTTPKSLSVEQGPEDIVQQNTDQFENTGQQVENLNQQSYNQFESFDQQNVAFDQHNMDHQMVDFGQQDEHLGQQFENFNQQNVNLDQQNINHHGFNMEQGPDEIQQQNMDQQFETSNQQSENLNQQSLNQFEELGQQSDNMGQDNQQLENFGQQSEGFRQENLNDFAQHEQFQQESFSNYGHQNENLNQNQKEQQLENWGQQNDNLEQQHQTEDLKQQIPFEPRETLQQQTDQVETFVPPSTYHKEGRDPQQYPNKPIIEQEIVTKKNVNVNSPPETVTEKVGFWNKVGSKFVSAKDKVASWFSKS